MTNVPPVEGWRATSPREVENVERSSWAYFLEVSFRFDGRIGGVVRGYMGGG